MTELERMARLLCEADGCDPDQLVFPYALPVDHQGRSMMVTAQPVQGWTFYSDYVRATLDAVVKVYAAVPHNDDTPDLTEFIEGILQGRIEATPIENDDEHIANTTWRDRYGLGGVPRAGLIPR